MISRRFVGATTLAIGAIALGSLAFAAVVPRDLNRQLDLIDVANGGAVIYGSIVTATVDTMDGGDVPWTVLRVKVEQSLGGDAVPSEVIVYSPGYADHRLSVSPAESETRVGEKVVMFLAVNPLIRARSPLAYTIDSYAEIFRTQVNRKGMVVVLGKGANFAVANNTLLTQVVKNVKVAFDAIAKPAHKNQD